MNGGVNVDPLNMAGAPDPTVLVGLGVKIARLVLRPAVLTYCQACRSVGLGVLGVVTTESGDPARYVGYPLDYLQVGNEMDGLSGGSSDPMDPWTFGALWSRCRAAFSGTPLIVGGLCSGDVHRGEGYWDAAPGAIAVGVHPYDKPALAAEVLLGQYRDLSGMDLWVTEWNRPAEEMLEFARMLSRTVQAHMWFCWSNGQVPGFGLEEPGKMDAFKEAIMPLVDEIQALLDRVSEVERVLGDMRYQAEGQSGVTRTLSDQNREITAALKNILLGRWNGEMPHAEANVKALNPTDTDWSGPGFPKG